MLGRSRGFATCLVPVFLSAVVLCTLGDPCAPGQTSATERPSVQVVNGVGLLLPSPWFVARRTSNAVEIEHPFPGGNRKPKITPGQKPRLGEDLVTAAARMIVEVDQYPTHAEAVKSLAHVSSERTEHPQLVVIAGWPAIERRRTAPLPNPGEAEITASTALAVFVTTTIAAGTQVVRFETVVAPGADPKLAELALEIARSVVLKPGDNETAKHDLETVSKLVAAPAQHLQENPRAPKSTRPIPPPPGPAPAGPAAALVQGGMGELEIAVSDDAQHVVVAANSGFSFSDDGGRNFTFGGGTPCVYNQCDGDPSLAVGKSGAIYYSWIGFPTNEPGRFPPPNGATDSVSVSADNGHTFNFAGNAVVCPSTAPAECSLPDQPHVAADRFSLSFAGLDRVYLVWRNFTSGVVAHIVCSIDGGLTWSNNTTVDAGGDFPRITVGGDGSVYVAYINGNNIMLRKFSSCDSGLTPQPPVTLASYVGDQACGNSPGPAPIPGLDRCNDGNILNSPTAAVDTSNPNQVYVAWATSTSADNEDVMLVESLDGASTFSPPVQVNSAVTGRRYMPWACALGGEAFVSWYDRRSATTAHNDLTDYFLGRVTASNGGLQPGQEVNLSQNPDPECGQGLASDWPCSTFETRDATSCSVQPQLAGRCSISGAACAFNGSQCGTQGGQCNGGRGCPKYGDYNGNTCVAGRVFTAWESTTSPPGVTAAKGFNIFASVFNEPDIQVTNLTQSGKNWCATITATEAGQPVGGSVTVNGVNGSTNTQICFPACSKTSTTIVCNPYRKPPCFPITITTPAPCEGTVTIPQISPIQIPVGPPPGI